MKNAVTLQSRVELWALAKIAWNTFQTTRSTKLSYAPNRVKLLSRFGTLRIRDV
jgi:hypothetical protein